MNLAKRKLSTIVKFHFVKLTYRSILFLLALGFYLYSRVIHSDSVFGGFEQNSFVLAVLWVFFVAEMVLRFFPIKMESPGCQKHFKKNYIAKCHDPVKLNTAKTTAITAILWIALNGIFAVLYYTGVFDKGIMYLIALAYSVCDIICILYFCPFRQLIMKNKCCATCRIYNWDYAMMFTPLLVVGDLYGLSLFAVAFVLLLIWEISVRLHPERFTESTNAALSCENCNEKLCHYNRGILKAKKNGIKENACFINVPEKSVK